MNLRNPAGYGICPGGAISVLANPLRVTPERDHKSKTTQMKGLSRTPSLPPFLSLQPENATVPLLEGTACLNLIMSSSEFLFKFGGHFQSFQKFCWCKIYSSPGFLGLHLVFENALQHEENALTAPPLAGHTPPHLPSPPSPHHPGLPLDT